MYGVHYYYYQECKLYIGNAGKKGMGVFTTQNIPADECIEICPVILIKDTDEVHQYLYEWDETYSALALGYGSYYNHSVTPNAYFCVGNYPPYNKKPTVLIMSLKSLEAGMEITINYNGDPTDKTPWDFSE